MKVKCWQLINKDTFELLVTDLTKSQALAKEEKAKELGIRAIAIEQDEVDLFEYWGDEDMLTK